MSPPSGGNWPVVFENNERHHKGVMNTPMIFEKVALKRAALASPSLLAVKATDEDIVVGRTER